MGSSAEAFFAVSAGERTVPGIAEENYWFRRHEACYDLVAGMLAAHPPGDGHPRTGPVVLDAGSGEGFGAARLADVGADVVALDYDAFAMAHHASTYPHLPGLRANLVGLPLRDGSVDLVVSLQTVEHVWDQDRFVAECLRVLRPGGTLVLSTPNRLTFPPGNVFHHRELDADELAALLAPHVREVTVRGLGHGPRLRAWEAAHGALVPALVATPPAEWDPGLAATVHAVAAADFAVSDDTGDALDLVAVAVAR